LLFVRRLDDPLTTSQRVAHALTPHPSSVGARFRAVIWNSRAGQERHNSMKSTPTPLLLSFVLLAIASACRTTSPGVSITVDSPTPSSAVDERKAVLVGSAWVDPECGLSDPPCTLPSKPFTGEIRVDGAAHYSLRADEDGTFSVEVRPGDYIVNVATSASLRCPDSIALTTIESDVTRITIRCIA
jgi:hypothetical protein